MAQKLDRLRPARTLSVVVFGAILAIATLVDSEWAGAASGTSPGGLLRGYWKAAPGNEIAEPVTFSFHRAELGAGRITVQLGPDGNRYVGNYLRLTGARPHSRIRVFHTYWVSDAYDDYRFGPGGAAFNRRTVTIEQFQSRYSGSVVATLTGQSGGGMRCLFELNDPKGGLANGATGRCQVSDGGIVELVRRTPK